MSNVDVRLHESGKWYEVHDRRTGHYWTFETRENDLDKILSDIRIHKAWFRYVKAHPELQHMYEENE